MIELLLKIVPVIFFAFIVIFVLIPLVTYYQVNKMQTPEKVIFEINDNRSEIMRLLDESSTKFIDEHNYEYSCSLASSYTTCSIWFSPDKQYILILYILQGKSLIVEFSSLFDEESSLDTISSKNAHTLPVIPGSYKQTFNTTSIPELYEKHQEALKFVKGHFGKDIIVINDAFKEIAMRALVLQMSYIKTLALWPLRAYYWFLIKRHLMYGKSVEDQYS